MLNGDPWKSRLFETYFCFPFLSLKCKCRRLFIAKTNPNVVGERRAMSVQKYSCCIVLLDKIVIQEYSKHDFRKVLSTEGQ